MDMAIPRGLLLFWKQGSGKTKGFLAAALYTLHKRADLYEKAAIVIVINKALQPAVLSELEHYIR